MKRNKKYRLVYICFFCGALLVFLTVSCLYASANDRKVADEAGLLTQQEAEKLQNMFSEIAEKFQCDVVVHTTRSCGGKSPQEYTDEYFYDQGYGYGQELDGIIFMVSMGDRKFHFATRGRAVDVFTDYGLEILDEQISGKLSDGDYYEAFLRFGELAENYLQEAEQGVPYDENHTYKAPMSWGVRILIMGAAGVIAAAAVLVILFAQLRSVGYEREAQEYVRKGSFHVTRSRDIFLYRTVTRHKIEINTSGGGGSTTHSSPGGGSSGGHTGSF